jgi:hypothetical protein
VPKWKKLKEVREALAGNREFQGNIGKNPVDHLRGDYRPDGSKNRTTGATPNCPE